MKILLVNSVYGTGSTGKIVLDLQRGLVELGHKAKVAYGYDFGIHSSNDEAISIEKAIGYYSHNICSRITDKAGFFSNKATHRLIKIINDYHPDLIHLHNLHGYYLNIEILFEFLKGSDIPIIWTFHDCWPMTGHCVHFSYINCKRWRNGCYKCPAKKKYPKSILFDNSTRNYECKKKLFTGIKNLTIVTPSIWLKGIVEQSFFQNIPVEVIPNGIDLKTFKPLKSNFREKYHLKEKKIVLAVANVWIEQKGIRDIIDISKRLKDNYQLVIVGLTEEQIKKFPENVIKIKRTNNVEELVQIYSAADVFINPSYEETMGLVTAEALACGTPVIVYNKTAVPEVVDEYSGVVIECGNISKMIDAIYSLKNYDKERIMQRAKYYEKKKQQSNYYCLYEKIINRK